MDGSKINAKSHWKSLSNAVLGFTDDKMISGNLGSLQMCSRLFSISNLNADALVDFTNIDSKAGDWIAFVPCDPLPTETIRTESRNLHLKVDKSLCFNGLSLKDRLHILSGFDNTGNVRLWFSELLLSHAFLLPHHYSALWTHLPTSAKRICEIGAGCSGAAGLSVSLSPMLKAEYILLTDGNGLCVDKLREAVQHHLTVQAHQTMTAEVEVLKLVWPEKPNEDPSIPTRWHHYFHLVLGADCFFRTESHSGLLMTIDKLLAHDRTATFVGLAPLRDGTLFHFIHMAKESNKWLVDVFAPNEYISTSFLDYLLQGITADARAVQETTLGHLVLLRRNSGT